MAISARSGNAAITDHFEAASRLATGGRA